LLERLNQSLGMLTGGPRDMPARQRTLRNAIDWSYNLLDIGERALFARLDVFVGSCTLDAVEAVCNANGDLPLAVIDGMTSLLDKSLLQVVDASVGEPRFRMLETIHEYARERLREHGEEASTRQHHMAFFLALAERAAPHLIDTQQPGWLARLETEHDNLRAALQWAIERQNTETALRLGTALWRFWWQHGYLTEGQTWLEALLALPKPSASSPASRALRADVLLGAARLANDQSNYRAARAYCGASQAIWQELGDQRGVALALETLGQIAIDQGDFVAARATLEQSLAISLEIGDKHRQASVLDMLAEVIRLQGDYATGRMLGEQGLALSQEMGNTHKMAQVLDTLAWNAISEGDYWRAKTLFEQNLAIYRERGLKQNISGVLMGLGDIAKYQGDYTTAAALYREGLTLRQELGDKRGSAMALANLGILALEQGDQAQVATLCRASLELSWSIQYMPGIAFCLFGFAGLMVLQHLPERAARLAGAATALSVAMTIAVAADEQAAYDRTIAGARTQLGEQAFAAAWAEGQTMPLDQAIAYALAEPTQLLK
jgi:tetratricopeptide (TPR) repeat protein